MKGCILFSPVGNSDPVRGGLDGPMLHILRNYPVCKVYLFMTGTILKQHHEYDCYVPYIYKLGETIGRNIEHEVLGELDITDPSDFDIFIEVFEARLSAIRQNWPDRKILINISSGTPQMISALCMIAVTGVHELYPVQVKAPDYPGTIRKNNFVPSDPFEKSFSNWGRRSLCDGGRASCLESGVDVVNCPHRKEGGLCQRCNEPRLVAFLQSRLYDIVRSRLNERDYRGAEAVACSEQNRDYFPAAFRSGVRVAALRADYQLDAARTTFSEAELGANPRAAAVAPQFGDVVEYYLTMKRRILRGEYSAFVLSISPLGYELLMQYLRTECGFEVGDCVADEKPSRLDLKLLAAKYPALYNSLTGKDGSDKAPMLTLGSMIFVWWAYRKLEKDGKDHPGGASRSALNEMNKEFSNLADVEAKLRNRVAHSMKSVGRNEFEQVTNATTAQFLERLEKNIARVMGVPDVTAFDQYDEMDRALFRLLDED